MKVKSEIRVMIPQIKEYKRLPGKHWKKLGESQRTECLPWLSEGVSSTETFMWYLWPPELGENQFLLFKAPTLRHVAMAALRILQYLTH